MRLFVFLILLVACSCTMAPSPDLSLADGRFAEGPWIVKRPAGYFLHYRYAERDLRKMINFGISDGKSCFYFGGKLSYNEHMGVIERGIPAWGEEKPADIHEVYWLDPDGKMTRLRVVELDLQVKDISR